VRFRSLIEAMHAAGVRVFVQVGPGRLASVIGDVLHGRDHLAVPANVTQHGGLAGLRRLATALWVEGADPDLELIDGRSNRDRPTPLDLGGSLVSLGDKAPRLRPAGRPWVTGVHGRRLPDLDVSIAHRAEVGVAIAGPRGAGVGIDVEEVVDRPESTVDAALADGELALLARLGAPRTVWFTRFWAAKEAVGKALGAGLAGQPRRFAVTAATGTELQVEVAGERHRVAYTHIQNPPDLPAREYVVAWTRTDGEAQ
jgi:phosphopantetheinyl transferase (holo-ACP synthase)